MKIHRGSLTRQQRDLLLRLYAQENGTGITEVPGGAAGRPFTALRDAGLTTHDAVYIGPYRGIRVFVARLTPAGSVLATEILATPDARKQPR